MYMYISGLIPLYQSLIYICGALDISRILVIQFNFSRAFHSIINILCTTYMLCTCVNTHTHTHITSKWIETFWREKKKAAKKIEQKMMKVEFIHIYKISWTRYYFDIVICSPFMNDGNDDIAHKLAAVHKRTEFIAAH